jgi:hypothetical protein
MVAKVEATGVIMMGEVMSLGLMGVAAVHVGYEVRTNTTLSTTKA